jgi:uncharacterized protein (TIGR02646 family)
VIRVERSWEPAPHVLEGKDADAAQASAAKYFEADVAATRQQLFKFVPLYRDEEAKSALRRLFSGKCAFCESLVDTSASPIAHHFRPKQEAVDADGGVSRPHYWWLAYDWENLYLSCQRCATAAGAQFPVEGKRASVGSRGSKLCDETALLLDPCRDNPDEHLAFQDDGSVAGLTSQGRHTIAVYALNRMPLVEARKQAILAGRDTAWEQLSDRGVPYVGALRQIYGKTRSAAYVSGSLFLRHWVVSLLRKALVLLPSLIKEATAGAPPVQPVIVERLELRDFRGIEWLELDLAAPDDEAPWTMLLGENGYGKTSVLQALALLMMGRDSRERLDLDYDALIRQGADTALVAAYLRGVIEPRTLRIERGGKVEASGDEGPCALAAYGAARIPSTRHRRASRRHLGQPRMENLFDAATPLIAADPWLAELDETSFDFAARALRRLLLEPEDTVVERRAGGVMLRTTDGLKDLRQLSDGYRSMIALAADVMSFFMTRYGSMDAAEGVVLVDELGAHLHPRWQMRIVEAFREAFPRLQFVVTTHDPLCLRGLHRKREVVVLRRTTTGQVYALPPTEVPSVRGLRVDELLTSEVFGLNSTIDPELERDFDRYYALLASGESKLAHQEIATLRERLDAHRQFGVTRRERLALEAADEYLAEEREVFNPGMREELLKKTKDRLRAIWAGEAG